MLSLAASIADYLALAVSYLTEVLPGNAGLADADDGVREDAFDSLLGTGASLLEPRPSQVLGDRRVRGGREDQGRETSKATQETARPLTTRPPSRIVEIGPSGADG